MIPRRLLPAGMTAALLAAAFVAIGGGTASAATPSTPQFGSSVHIFSPAMDQATS